MNLMCAYPSLCPAVSLVKLFFSHVHSVNPPQQQRPGGGSLSIS